MNKDNYYRVLDDGFIGIKDWMGSDEDIERAARVSYGKGTRKVNETKGLLRYLMRHRHSTPFEMAELVFHVRLPLYVVRQWNRHRTWNFNEYSGRYSEMIDSCEKTDPNVWRTQSVNNKQGSGGNLPFDDSGPFCGKIFSEEEEYLHKLSRRVYEHRLEGGVAKEQARKDLPVSNYTEMYAKVDLKNLFGFLSLRCDSHAQLETRSYANVMASIVKELFPISFNGWYDYQFCNSNWTRLDQELFTFINANMCNSSKLSPKIEVNENSVVYALSIGMSKREIEEFKDKLFQPKSGDFDIGNYELLTI